MPSLLVPPTESRAGAGSAGKWVGVALLAVVGAVLVWWVTGSPAEPTGSFLEQRARAPTKLVFHGPAPQEWKPAEPPEGVRAITYPSGTFSLKAWYALPKGAAPTNKVPALVYFHGGFAFTPEDFETARPFLDKGFAVFTPMLRAENGNPGEHEMYWGELDDARAAVAWLQQQPEIDVEHVYSLGHSAGGVISALLSLCDTPKLRMTASINGTYSEAAFNGYGVPFENKPRERKLRSFASSADLMVQKHTAFVGREDVIAQQGAEVASARAKSELFDLVMMPGDHFKSLDPSVAEYLKRVEADVKLVAR